MKMKLSEVIANNYSKFNGDQWGWVKLHIATWIYRHKLNGVRFSLKKLNTWCYMKVTGRSAKRQDKQTFIIAIRSTLYSRFSGCQLSGLPWFYGHRSYHIFGVLILTVQYNLGHFSSIILTNFPSFQSLIWKKKINTNANKYFTMG